MRFIPVLGAGFAIVDDEDYERLSAYSWFPYCYGSATYPKTNTPRINGVRTSLAMHQMILPKRAGYIIDHKDTDGMNNQRHNLRYATRGQNKMNSIKRKASSSKYKGVSVLPGNKWKASFKANGNETRIGVFDNEIDAARAYDREILIAHGEFARPNGV